MRPGSLGGELELVSPNEIPQTMTKNCRSPGLEGRVEKEVGVVLKKEQN